MGHDDEMLMSGWSRTVAEAEYASSDPYDTLDDSSELTISPLQSSFSQIAIEPWMQTEADQWQPAPLSPAFIPASMPPMMEPEVDQGAAPWLASVVPGEQKSWYDFVPFMDTEGSIDIVPGEAKLPQIISPLQTSVQTLLPWAGYGSTVIQAGSDAESGLGMALGIGGALAGIMPIMVLMMLMKD